MSYTTSDVKQGGGGQHQFPPSIISLASASGHSSGPSIADHYTPVRPLTQIPIRQNNSSILNHFPFWNRFASDNGQSNRFQDRWMESVLIKKLRPNLNRLGRFFLVLTFIEDSIRIINQSTDQIEFLLNERHFSRSLSVGYLILTVALMLGCSILVIFRSYPKVAFFGFFTIMMTQGFVYRLIADPTFACLSLSLLGGLMLNISNQMIEDQEKIRSTEQRTMSLNLPSSPDLDDQFKFKLKTLQFLGRIFLITFFVGHTIFLYIDLVEEFEFWISLIGLLSIGASVFIAIGFKAKWSTMFLVIVSSVVNVMANDWWSKPKDHPEREFRKYDFFQAVSIVGGMILLINQGPGGISLDEKRKIV